MERHGDGATPLWLTEFGWGSAPPDRFGINQGPAGQAKLLRGSFELALRNRAAWNVQRLYWFLWRDPAPNSRFAHRCSFCGSAGLLRHDRTAKAAFNGYIHFSADKTPPHVIIRSGPRQRGLHEGSNAHLLVLLERARLHLQVPSRRKPVRSLHLAADARATERRRAPLRHQGDRRGRKREPDRIAHVHRRHSRAARPADHGHGPQLARQQQPSEGEGHSRVRCRREALRNRRLHGHPDGPRPGRPIRLPGPPRLGRGHARRRPSTRTRSTPPATSPLARPPSTTWRARPSPNRVTGQATER